MVSAIITRGMRHSGATSIPQQQCHINKASDCVLLWCRYGGKLVEDGEMDLEAMLTVFYAILLSTMGMADAQMAFPKVAHGKQAVARVFRGVSPRTDAAPTTPLPCPP